MMKIKILSQAGTVFDGEVTHVTFPGETGRFTVYPLHAPILSALRNGDIECFTPDEEKNVYPIRNGYVEVVNDNVMVCVELTNEQMITTRHG